MSLLQTLKMALLWLLVAGGSLADTYSHPEVERLLQAEQPPDGVVIEVISWNPDTWDWATPMISQFRQQLDQRFPGIDVAVVSHGGEQFQLTRDNLENAPAIYQGIASLTEQGVDFHVCGTHSEWKGVAESEYVDLVDVSPSGPAQINDYKSLGYQLIVLKSPD